MKRKLILLMCVLALVVACFAACDGDSGNNNNNNGGNNNTGNEGTGGGNTNTDCEHTFSDEWFNSEDGHWHPATCEHAETERGDFSAHSDADENGLCDVCEFEVGHTHTFSGEWTITETHHWKAATCTHTTLQESYSAHSDEDMDGVCDVCEGHVHTPNPIGYCHGCEKQVKAIDETSLTELINAVLFQKHFVNGGTIDYNVIARSNTGIEHTASKTDIVKYDFGKDGYTHVLVDTSSTNGTNHATGKFESWHQPSGGDQAFGVYKEDDNPYAPDFAEAAKLNGYHIDLSTLAGDYGVEETLYALYEAAISDTVNELEVIPDTAENKVTFKYNYKTAIINGTNISYGDDAGNTHYNVNYYEVEVTFTYNDDFALTSLMINVDRYTNDPGGIDVPGGTEIMYKDVDIYYDPDTEEITFIEYYQDETGTWVTRPTDNRTPDTYTISVIQSIGERTAENPQPKSNFVPTDFNMYSTWTPTYNDEGMENGYILSGLITGDVNIKVGQTAYFFISDYTPVGTSLSFIPEEVSLKLYKDGVEVENPQAYDNPIAYATFTLRGDLREFFVIPKVDGIYKLEMYVMGELIKSVNIYTKNADIGNVELAPNQFAVKVTEKFEWANEVSFTATKTGTYYFNFGEKIGFIDADGYDAADKTPATDDTPEPYFDYNNAKNEDGSYNKGSFSLDLVEGQTVRFYVNAMEEGIYKIDWYVF